MPSTNVPAKYELKTARAKKVIKEGMVRRLVGYIWSVSAGNPSSRPASDANSASC